MELEGDDTCARLNELRGERAGSGANIENEGAASNAGLGDDAPNPVLSEAVPSPRRPMFRGHGTSPS
jgi:hypothetical protein